jgi:hypothetical protein
VIFWGKAVLELDVTGLQYKAPLRCVRNDVGYLCTKKIFLIPPSQFFRVSGRSFTSKNREDFDIVLQHHVVLENCL